MRREENYYCSRKWSLIFEYDLVRTFPTDPSSHNLSVDTGRQNYYRHTFFCAYTSTQATRQAEILYFDLGFSKGYLSHLTKVWRGFEIPGNDDLACCVLDRQNPQVRCKPPGDSHA